MVRKIHKGGDADDASGEGTPGSAGRKSGPPLSDTVRASAQQIWLAGLGAFSKAQEEGGKVFEALVKEGVTLQRRTQDAAEGTLNEATTRMSSMASEFSARASGQWDKLETIFEERVARALKTLGVPTAREVATLAARVEELDRRIAQMSDAGTRGPAAKKAAGKVVRKRAPARKRPASD